MSDALTLRSLFTPVNIGSMTVKNRIALSPMATSFATKEGLITERAINYYAARARGGVGLIITENVGVDFPRGTAASNRPRIDSDLTLPGLSELARAIQKNGARAIIQLNHAGRKAKFSITGFQPVAPSPLPFTGGSAPPGEVPRELTIAEIAEIVKLFAQAAARAKRAGFDGIEVMAAHGYLLDEFLSPASNQRRDKYSGSLENRARMLLEVLRAIRETVGTDYPLWCRINGQEFGIKNGLTLDDAKVVATMVDSMVDAIHVTAWGYGRDALVYFPDLPGALLPLAQKIKEVVTVPVIAVGRLNAEAGEQAISKGQADIIAIGRGLLADPEIVNKAASGRREDIRPCIACFYCQDHAYISNSPIACAVNADVGREIENEIKPAKKVKKIAIIGGGPAGMEAARALALRGHKVVLLEKEDHLGGQMSLAMVPPYKRERIEPLLTYFMGQLQKLQVEIKLNTAASVELIEEIGPEAVILAAGAEPIVPELPGVAQANVVTALDILAGRAETGHKVVIIGGGSVGCETAELLYEKGKEVTVVEMLPALANDMGFRDRMRLLNRITTLPINFMTKVKCTGIQEKGVIITTDGNQEQSISADTIILAVGLKPNNSLFPLLKAKGFETYLAGDCWHIGKVAGAIEDGSRLGHLL